MQFVLQPDNGARTIRLEVLSQLYPDATLTGYIPAQFIVDGQAHDIRVRTGRNTFHFDGLGPGNHTVAARFAYHIDEWVQCQFHPGWLTTPTIRLGADTTAVQLEIVSTVHCHFL